jgi:hypothetical protein
MIVFSFIINKKVTIDVNKGNPPETLKNFPVHQASPEQYLETKNKVNHFIDLLATDNKNIELSLNENDLNNLYSKGITIDIYQPGRYFYYSIQEDYILEKTIEWPLFLVPKPYNTRKKIIYFDRLKQHKKVGKEEFSTIPLSKFALILFIFGASRSPALLSYKFDETVEYQRALTLIGQLKKIEISNHFLILTA